MASMNPFSKADATAAQNLDPAPGMSESFASMTDNAKNGMSTFGASARNAVGKTTNAVAGVFRKPTKPDSESDPLSLDNKPEKVNSDVYVANGQLWESSGDLTKAMESYTRALESEPNDAQALSSIARLNYRQGKFQKANDYFNRAMTNSPQDAELHNDIGLTRSKLNDPQGSVVSFEKALKLAPGTSRYANNLATVHFEAGDSTAAYRVLVSNNKPAVAHFNMAYLHFKNGQMNDAKKHLNGAVQFESQGASDDIVKRAVDRSREMLAQIDASTAPVAQAAPQATIAGGQFFNGPQTSPVQQTARSVAPPATKPADTMSPMAPKSTMAPKPPMAPASHAITPPPAPTYIPINPAASTQGTIPGTIPATIPGTTPATSTWNRQPASSPVAPVASAPLASARPVRPTPPVAKMTSDQPEPNATTSGFSFPFSLPTDFDQDN